MKMRGNWLGGALCGLWLLPAGNAWAQNALDANVVVLSDTSDSMRTNDPQNAVVLVTRLFADIVPGRLAAVRLFDVGRDKNSVPTESTNQKVPCPDKPSEMCDVVNLGPGALDKVLNQHLLVATRPARGDSGFKSSLEDLLRPSAMSTKYAFSFASIGKLYQDNPSPAETPRVIVWLSDGDADDWDIAKAGLKTLMEEGASVRALIFKSGKTDQVKQLGIQPDLVDGSPRALMAAFADAFRQIVQAPFRVDGTVAGNPNFAIKPRMEDVWVVVYGDESLSGASVSGDGRTQAADYASDHYRGSAYRVAYLKNPREGNWIVSATGGGPNASYAVIQRSTITPFVVNPGDIFTGVPFRLDVTLRTSGGTDLLPSDLPEPVKLEATLDGQTIPLHDDGTNGDQKANDGHYSAMLTASHAGPLVISVRARNSFLDRTVQVKLEARGYFRYSGGPVTLDFGTFRAGQTVCRPLALQAEQQGAVPFELREVAPRPAHLQFELRGAGKHSAVGAAAIPLLAQDDKQVCLAAGRDAASSESHAQSWVSLAVAGRQDPGSTVELRMNWSIRALTFWERWGWLILLILGVLLVLFVIYGYIKPYRFPPGLALCYAPALNELDDQTPQPVRLWRGVGIGFYRDARACLQDNFRINGKVKGAVSILQAGKRRSVLVRPGARALYREVGLGEWDQVPPTGRRAGQGEIYRVGESGPYFRLSMRMAS